jgi:squalene monooxygenase
VLIIYFLLFIQVYLGSARKMVHAGEARAEGEKLLLQRSSVNPPPRLVRYAADGTCIADEKLDDAVSISSLALPPSSVPDDNVVGIAWKTDSGKELVTTARITIICDGMYSTLRSKVSGASPRTISYFSGVLLHHPENNPPLPHPGRGHVILMKPSPVLLYQIAPTHTRLLADIPARNLEQNGELNDEEARAKAIRNYLETNVMSQIPEVSRASLEEALKTQEPVTMPCKHLPAVEAVRPGSILLGDSWNMRHPLTGGGMTVALRDAETLRNVLRDLDLQKASWNEVEARVAEFRSVRTLHASTINILSIALYRVFSCPPTDNGTRARLRDACIDYLALGGPFAAGPIGLLSGLSPRPSILIMHFFAVAVHAIVHTLFPFPTLQRMRRGYDLLHIACVILMPLLVSERVEGWSSTPVLSLVNFFFPWKDIVLTE